ncbi:glycosyltransferase [Pelagibacterales bacterium SAG-MED15]|nr:glycosyltransferase [Pelagibacterales bacterium SAG-MED15]
MSKRVVIFIPSIEEGGVEKNLYIVSDYLIKKDLKIDILTCNYNKKKKLNKNVKFIGTKNSFWFNKNRKVKYLICLLYLFFYLLFNKSKKIVFAFQANIYAILISKLCLTTVITRSNSSPSGWSNNYFKKKFYSIVIRLANDVMVNSYQFKKEFKKLFNIDAKCILNPFDKSYFSYENKTIKKKGFKKLSIISIGRLTDQKDHLTLLKSAKLIDSKLNPRITIIGKGEKYNSLVNFIKKNKLNKIVKLIGYQQQPTEYLRDADIFILTSKYEGLPNVLLEAQYFKKYIISTNCPTGPKEILLNGKAGDLIKIGDYKKLSSLINQFPKRKKKILNMIKHGSKYFSRFDYRLNCEKYLAFVKNSF